MTFIREHSLSITLGILGLMCTVLSAVVEHGGWWYDTWMMLGGVLLGGAIMAVAERYLYERDCDPSKPPE